VNRFNYRIIRKPGEVREFGNIGEKGLSRRRFVSSLSVSLLDEGEILGQSDLRYFGC